jgi:hypothetical protein
MCGKIGGGLMAIEKQEDDTTIERFLAVKETISFMRLRKSAEGKVRTEVFTMPLLEEQMLYEPGTVEYACTEHFCSYEQFVAKLIAIAGHDRGDQKGWFSSQSAQSDTSSPSKG